MRLDGAGINTSGKDSPGFNQAAKAGLCPCPGAGALAQVYSGKLTGFALSFIIAGVLWISHHRRLARQPVGSRGVVFLNLLFPLSIVQLMPPEVSRRIHRPAGKA